MAAVFLAITRRSAMRARSLVMRSRRTPRLPVKTGALVVETMAGAGLATGALPAFSMSALVTRPPGPVPSTLAMSTPLSAAILRATLVALGSIASAAGAAAGAGLAAGAAPAGRLALSSIFATMAPTF